MGVEDFFNLPGIGIESSHQDQILFAIRNDQEPVLVEVTDIPGQEVSPSLDLPKHVLIGVRLVPIAFHDLRAVGRNLAILASGQFLHTGVEVHDLDVRPDKGRSHGTELTLLPVRGIHGQDRGGLGETVPFKDHRSRPFLELFDHLQRKGGGTRTAPSDGGQIKLVGQRVVDDGRINGGNRHEGRHFIVFYGLEHIRERGISGAGIGNADQA